MTGSKGEGRGSSVKEDGELDVDDGAGSTTKEQTTAEKDSSRRSASGRMVTGRGAESSAASAPMQPETAAVVPPAGGFGHEESKVGEQETLREQLEALVSHKLRVNGGELDHAGLVALEALSKLPAPRDLTNAGAGGGAGDGRPKKILPLGLEKIRKFSGNNIEALSDIFNQFYSLVVAALPFQSAGAINKALTRDVVFILEGSALKFYNSLKAGEVEWESLPPTANTAAVAAAPLLRPETPGATAAEGKLQHHQEGRGERRFRPPSTWAELSEAFHDHFLPAAGIARISEKLLSSSQAPGESVLSLAQRQLGLATHLNRVAWSLPRVVMVLEIVVVVALLVAVAAVLAVVVCSRGYPNTTAPRNAARLWRNLSPLLRPRFLNNGRTQLGTPVAMAAMPWTRFLEGEKGPKANAGRPGESPRLRRSVPGPASEWSG